MSTASATLIANVETPELALQAAALARLAGSVAHEVKNPLNAMALQVALLGDKLASMDERLASSCEVNLSSIKNQIGKIDEVVRRYVEVADPVGSAGGFDAGTLLVEVASLFGHELRRRQASLGCETSQGTLRAAGDGVRATRLLLGMVWREVSRMPPGGRLVVRAALVGANVELAIEHPPGDADPALDWVDGIVAASARDLGGALETSTQDGVVRVALRLPREGQP